MAERFDEILALEDRNKDLNVSKMIVEKDDLDGRLYGSRTCDTLVKSGIPIKRCARLLTGIYSCYEYIGTAWMISYPSTG